MKLVSVSIPLVNEPIVPIVLYIKNLYLVGWHSFLFVNQFVPYLSEVISYPFPFPPHWLINL